MDNNELYHYGVVGMRWGVRKDPEYRRARREARAARYDKKAARYARKSSKYRAKAHRGLLRTSVHAEYLRRSDRFDYKSQKAAERAAKIRNQQARDSEKAARYVERSIGLMQRSVNAAQNNSFKPYSPSEARKIILNSEAKSRSLMDKARSFDSNAGSGTFRFGNYAFNANKNTKTTYDEMWDKRIPAEYKKTYGEELRKDMKHSGISMRDVMEFAEYLDDCGATLQHAAVRKRGSKYKGGFKSVNGRLNNTSEYNHDYYIHNKDKWNKQVGVRTGSGTEEDPYVIRYNTPGDYKYISDWMRTNKDAWIYDEKSNSYIPTEGNPFVPQGHYRTEYNGPNKVSGRSRKRSVTRSMDPNEPMGTFYTFNNGKTSMYSPKNLRGTGSGGKKDPEYNKRNRPHSRKRGEATASGKVFRRPEVYNPLTGEYESYTLGRGRGNNGNKKNPTRSTPVTRSMFGGSDEERLVKNRVGKYRTSNTRRRSNVIEPASKDRDGTRYVDNNGLVWVKGSGDRWTTMNNNRVSIKTSEELRRIRNKKVKRK